MKFGRALTATACFLLLLVAIYYIHISFFAVNVVFYAAIADAVMAAAIVTVLLFFMPYFSPLGSFEKLELVLIWLITGYSIAISVPTVIDRSLSFYILEKLEQRGGGIKQASFEDVFTKEYMHEYRLVDIRLTEQLQSGTIQVENGCVKLTDKGRAIAAFGSYFRKNWLPKARLLMGAYSDDLVDPFKHSIAAPDYQCK